GNVRGDLPRIAATLNKVLKSDRPRLALPGLFCFQGDTKHPHATERDRPRTRLDLESGRRVRLRRRRGRPLAPRHGPDGAGLRRPSRHHRAPRLAPSARPPSRRGPDLPGLSRRVPAPGALVVAALAVHESHALVCPVPALTVETKHARAVLPPTVPHAQAALAAAKSAALVIGLAHADPRLLAAGLDDVLHVPYRRPLVAGYDEVSDAARQAGAHGATLSGSGPTILALAPAARAPQVADAMARAWRARGIVVECLLVARPAGGYEAA